MKVWTVKLASKGGILSFGEKKLNTELNKLPERFRTKLDKDTIKKIKAYKGIPEYCKEKGIVSIGWSLEPEEEKRENITFDEFEKEYIDRGLSEGWLTKRAKNIIQKFYSIENGDICWVRDSDDYYYVCKIDGDWEYSDDPVDWALDTVERHRCTWKKVGNVMQIPALIARKLTMIGDTVSEIDIEDEKNKIIYELSEFLFNSDDGIVQKYISEFNTDKIDWSTDIFDNLTQYDYEDFVGLYLQQSYYIVPSTRTPSTKDYEFVLIDRKDYHTAAVQAKYQDKQIDAADYENRLGSLDKIYLACTSGVKMVKNESKIVEIKKDDMLKFFKENVNLLPARTRFLAVYLTKKRKDERKE